jgi:MFS family permease
MIHFSILDTQARKIKPGNMFIALKYHDFRFFWLCQSISLTGTWIQNLAFTWLTFTMTNSPLWTGIAWMLQFLPLLFFSFHAGSLIERFSKTKVFFVTQTITFILSIILGITTRFEIITLWELLGIAFLSGLANTFDLPARQALIPELVDRNVLTNAIGLNALIFNVARMAGPLIAGIVINYFQMDTCFFLNSLSFLPLLFWLTALAMKPPKKAMETPVQKPRFWRDIKEDLRFILGIKPIFVALTMLAGINFFGMLYVIVPFLMQNNLLSEAGELGIVFAVNSLGAIIGSAGTTLYPGKTFSIKILTGLTIGLGIFELLLIPITALPLIYLMLGVAGFAMSIFDILIKSLIQIHAPNGLSSRIMSIYFFVLMGLSPIGILVSCFMTALWGVSAALGIAAVLCLAVPVALAFRFPNLLKPTIWAMNHLER